jgi:hypothetical protein
MKGALTAAGAAGAIPASTATGYPDNSWGTALKDVACMVKADVDLRVASVNDGG